MANVALFRSGQTPQYLLSVHTPDYASDPDALINPDVSALTGVPTKYWKRVVNAVQEMTAQEKQALDDAEALAVKNAIPEIIAAQWHQTFTKTNIGTSFVNIYSDAGYAGFPIFVDFRNRKFFAFVLFWSKIGTGTHNVRAINNGNTLFDIEVVDGRNFVNYADLPAWATGIKEIRLQCKSTVSTDDPIFRGGYIALK